MAADLTAIINERIIILDGAMGTMLQNRGMQPGMCPELFGVQHPDILEDIHYQYVEAGSDIIQTNTFGANYYKLVEYGLENEAAHLNAESVRIAKKASRGKALVAASIGPTGRLLKPMGEVEFDDLYRVFFEQVKACAAAGADLISIETMADLGEMRAALIASRQAARLPVLAHMTFEGEGRTLTGTDPVTALLVLEALQPLAIGANCSGGARELLKVIEAMSPYASVYLSVEPNAGLPQLVEGSTVFPDSPEEMAEYALKLREAGANIIGGCCGSTPQHIQAMAAAVKGLAPQPRASRQIRAFASRSNIVFIGPEYPLAFIGERINPTARKALAADIKEGRMLMVVEEARKQMASGAPILDVNMGVPGIDEPEAMKRAVIELQAAVDLPLSIDSTNAAAVEEGLKHFVGRALINSTTGEERQLERILPLASKYGAAVLGLCLDEQGIPARAGERFQIAARIQERGKAYGLRDEDIYIDCLVKTASAEQEQVMETLRALQQVKEELGLATVLGISNVSHGLPARPVLTSTYLAMAWSAGLDLPIMNPFDDKVMDVTRAAAVLLNRDPYAGNYIERYKNYQQGPAADTAPIRHPVCLKCNIPDLLEGKPERDGPENCSTSPPETPAAASGGEELTRAVLQGSRDKIENLVQNALEEQKIPALEIVNRYLIPGIEAAGEMYDRKEYFLPQLMMAAETMKKAFGLLKPYLQESREAGKGKIVMATVEGDIHDIGKNIVCILLENYGFEVIDLGKDVPSQVILDTAEAENAALIGLSALMTTTMPRMAEVIEEVKRRKLRCKIMVGGAVLNQEYADRIGADGYAQDARKAVVIAQQLLN